MRHWDETWMLVAQVMSRRSLCTRARVGAEIVSADHRIVATGYNGPPRGFNHMDAPCTSWCKRSAGNDPKAADYSDCPSSHAESNAFMAADRSAWQGGTLYVTSDVCAGCTKLIANSGLARVIVQLEEESRDYRNSDRSYDFIRSLGIDVKFISMSDPPLIDDAPNVYMGDADLIQVKTFGEWINVHRGPERVGGISTDWT